MKSVLICLFLFLLSASCPKGPEVKVFVSVPQRDGIYRAQDKELLPYKETFGYYCMSKEDFKALVLWCKNK